MKADPAKPNELKAYIAKRLKELRGERHMTAEDVAQRTNGRVSGSYILRVELQQYRPTAETLQAILLALDSNLGLFFEHMVQADPKDRDRVYHRILQRALDSDLRDGAIATINILERALRLKTSH